MRINRVCCGVPVREQKKKQKRQEFVTCYAYKKSKMFSKSFIPRGIVFARPWKKETKPLKAEMPCGIYLVQKAHSVNPMSVNCMFARAL